MRGTLKPFETVALFVGITPAHAGNTGSEEHSLGQPEDHPRTCGEHSAT